MLNSIPNYNANKIGTQNISFSKTLINSPALSTINKDVFTKKANNVFYISFSGAKTPLDKTPINSLLKATGAQSVSIEEAKAQYKDDTAYTSVLSEIEQNGFTRKSFPELRQTLQNDQGGYDLKKLSILVKAATSDHNSKKPIPTIREQNPDTNWLYQSNMVEYVNIRAMGTNSAEGKKERNGNVLDAITYALQSRGGVFHLAPFHPSSFLNQQYIPKDTYAVDENIISPELSKIGLNPRSQFKLFADVCHSLKQPVALFYDTLPHTGEASVNYLDKPEAARWIHLDKKEIDKNSENFDAAKTVIELSSPQNTKEFQKDLKVLFSAIKDGSKNGVIQDELKDSIKTLKELKTVEKSENPDGIEQTISIELKYALKNVNKGARTKDILSAPKQHIEGKEKEIQQELFKLTLRKALVVSTHLAETDMDIEFMRKNSEHVWKTAKDPKNIPSAEVGEILVSKDSSKIAKEVKNIVSEKIGKAKPTYEDVQASEKDYEGSIAQRLRNKDFIFNMPVGAWNGLMPELIGFHKEHKYPIFSCRGNAQTNFRYQNSNEMKDTAWKMFGTFSRRQFNLPNGQPNKAAFNEWEEAIGFWLKTGFDGLRLDQTDHLYTKPMDFNPKAGKTMEQFFADNDFAYDTMLPQDIKKTITDLRGKLGKGIPAFYENMMYHSMPEIGKSFNEIRETATNSITGKFQFYDNFNKLLEAVGIQNKVRKETGSSEFMLNTIECHDNQLSGKNLGPKEVQGQGTGPASKAMDGLTNIRARFVLNSLGLPYITTQALLGIHSDKLKSSQTQDTIMSPINYDFDDQPPTYKVGNSEYSYNEFKHNYFDFTSNPQIKSILKNGQVEQLGNNENVLLFSVSNDKSEKLIFAINTGSTSVSDIDFDQTKISDNSKKITEYSLDGKESVKSGSKEFLSSLGEEISNMTLEPAQIRIFKVKA